MKKYFKSWLMIVIMCALLTGCGNGSRSSADGKISEIEKNNSFVGSETQTKETDGEWEDEEAATMTQKGSGEAGEKRLISSSLEETAQYQITSSSTDIQSLVQYCNGTLSYDEASRSGSVQNRKFKGDREDFAVIKAYVEMLCAGDKNLELADTYMLDYKDTMFAYAIDYTGSGKVNGNISMQFKKDVICDICIWGTIEYDRMEVRVQIPVSMNIVDMGYRYGGYTESLTPGGPSALTALYQLPDKSFETADGRLHTEWGKACVLRDGTAYMADSEYVLTQYDYEELWIRDFCRNESLFFLSPYNQLMTGDVYNLDVLERKGGGVIEGGTIKESFLSGMDWGTMLAVEQDGTWVTPVYGEDSAFEDVTVRVMYYEPDEAAILYIYAEMNSEPYNIEALCAVQIEEAQENDDSGSYSGGYGDDENDYRNKEPGGVKVDCIKCHGKGEVPCDLCDGSGYREIYNNSTPNYSGRNQSPAVTKESCRKCGGSGSMTCPRCNGSETEN